MTTMIDHLNREVELPNEPLRIISICPAITNTLFEIGAGNTIIGRTEYCIFPKGQIEGVPVVGGTKQVDFEKIRQLKPNLILAEKEENTKVIVKTLEKEFPVFVFEVQSVEENERFITDLGKLAKKEEQAAHLLNNVQQALQKIPKFSNENAAYMIWQEPYMVVGHNTYIHAVLESMGFINPFTDRKSRYPIIQLEDLKQANLQYLLLASEPFHFTEEHRDYFSNLLPNTTVLNVDGEMFWYGSNSVPGFQYLQQIFQE